MLKQIDPTTISMDGVEFAIYPLWCDVCFKFVRRAWQDDWACVCWFAAGGCRG